MQKRTLTRCRKGRSHRTAAHPAHACHYTQGPSCFTLAQNRSLSAGQVLTCMGALHGELFVLHLPAEPTHPLLALSAVTSSEHILFPAPSIRSPCIACFTFCFIFPRAPAALRQLIFHALFDSHKNVRSTWPRLSHCSTSSMSTSSWNVGCI